MEARVAQALQVEPDRKGACQLVELKSEIVVFTPVSDGIAIFGFTNKPEKNEKEEKE